MTKADCWAVTSANSVTSHGKRACVGDADVCIIHDRDDLWTHQYNALQQMKFDDPKNSDFKLKCETTPVCIYCKKMWDILAVQPAGSVAVSSTNHVKVGCSWIMNHKGKGTPQAVGGQPASSAACATAAAAKSGAKAASYKTGDKDSCKYYTGTTIDKQPGTSVTTLSTCTNTTSTKDWTAMVQNHTSVSARSRLAVAYCEMEMDAYVGATATKLCDAGESSTVCQPGP
jgi:hypothetical protein